MNVVDQIAVVVPAKNEEAMLPACLEALVIAARQVAAPVEILVVLDSCRDRSDLVVLRHTRAAQDVAIRSITTEASCVGAARRQGMADVLRRFSSATTWLATTDADSAVPRNWLSSQLDRAAAGFEVVVGTVTVSDWSQHSDEVRNRAVAAYAAVPHRHVHGTSLGFSGASYVRVGGFPAFAEDEDVRLVAAFEAAGDRVAWAAEAPVVTSARRVARAPRGFAGYLVNLASD